MHAVLITYQSTVRLDALLGPLADHALAIAAAPGLLAKTWLVDGMTLGGFHLFTDRAAAEAYLDGASAAALAAHPAFARCRIQHYGVLEELSLITRGPPPITHEAAPRRSSAVSSGETPRKSGHAGGTQIGTTAPIAARKGAQS